MRTIYLDTKDPFILGKTGESNRTALRVNVESWYQEYPDGNGVILFMRPNRVVFPLETNLIEYNGEHYLEAIVTSNETKMAGFTVVTAQWYDGESLVHGLTFSGKVLTSAGSNPTDGVTETTPTWVSQLIAEIDAINEASATVTEAYEKVVGTIGYVTPQMFGAKGDGKTDDTIAIKQAIASGKSVYFPVGSYIISENIDITSNNINLFGEYGKTVIWQTTTENGFSLNGCLKVHLYNLRIQKSTDAVDSSANIADVGISIVDSQDCIFENIWVDGFEVGVYLHGTTSESAANMFFNNINIRHFSKYGIYSDTFVDAYFNHFYLTAGAANNTTAVGINLINKNEAIVFDTGEILRCKNPLIMDSESSYYVGTRVVPSGCRFINVWFDSYSDICKIRRSKTSVFENCYFHNGWTDGGNGIEVLTSHYITFSGCQILGCGLDGCIVDQRSTGIIFNSCIFANNNYQGEEGDYCGIRVKQANYTSIMECTFTNQLGTIGNQTYGVMVESGADKTTIQGCRFEGVTIYKVSELRNKTIITDCIGIHNFNDAMVSEVFNNAQSITMKIDYYSSVGNTLLLMNGNIKTAAMLSVESTPKITVIVGTTTYTASFNSATNEITITPSEKLWGKTVVSYM